MMKCVSLLTRPANESKKENWHLVPCKHNYCGPAKVKEYFEDLIEPFVAQGSIVPETAKADAQPGKEQQVVSYLYGNLLVGRQVSSGGGGGADNNNGAGAHDTGKNNNNVANGTTNTSAPNNNNTNNSLQGYLVRTVEGKNGRTYERICSSDKTTVWSKDLPVLKDEDFLLGLTAYCTLADLLAEV